MAKADVIAGLDGLTSPSNACRLDRALQSVVLKPTYEDLFQAESGSVEEYLEQMHEMTVVTAIQVSPTHGFKTPCDKYKANSCNGIAHREFMMGVGLGG